MNYLQIRNDNNNPVLQQQKRERELAMKLVRKAELLREREDLATQNKAVKLVAKVAEKARREAFTVAESKAEDLLKKIENQLRKAAPPPFVNPCAWPQRDADETRLATHSVALITFAVDSYIY